MSHACNQLPMLLLYALNTRTRTPLMPMLLNGIVVLDDNGIIVPFEVNCTSGISFSTSISLITSSPNVIPFDDFMEPETNTVTLFAPPSGNSRNLLPVATTEVFLLSIMYASPCLGWFGSRSFVKDTST